MAEYFWFGINKHKLALEEAIGKIFMEGLPTIPCISNLINFIMSNYSQITPSGSTYHQVMSGWCISMRFRGNNSALINAHHKQVIHSNYILYLLSSRHSPLMGHLPAGSFIPGWKKKSRGLGCACCRVKMSESRQERQTSMPQKRKRSVLTSGKKGRNYTWASAREVPEICCWEVFKLLSLQSAPFRKDRQKIENIVSSSDSPVLVLAKKRCIVCDPKFELIDSACWQRFCQQPSKGAPVSGVLFQEKS